MLRHLVLLPLAAALLGAGPPPQAKKCTMIGSTYIARPAVASEMHTHRLKIDELPRSAEDHGINTLWRFQTLDRGTGKQVSELRMHQGCPNGRGLCAVFVPSRPGPESGRYSELVRLNSDFSPAVGDDAPFALVLPGFQTSNWVFADLASPDLTLAPYQTDGPDLSAQIVWVRSACGPT